MRCDDALPLLYELVDDEGDLDRDDAAALASHLARCPACAAALTEIESREGLYRERLGAVASTRTSEEVAEAIWNDGAVPVRLAADGAPFAFAAGTAAAAGIALAGTTDFWGPRLVSWLDSVRSAIALPSALASARPDELFVRFRDSALALVSAPAASSGGAVLILAVVLLSAQVAGSFWLLRAGRGAREERTGEAS
jgi:anti-sigma factor RsiW